MKPENILDTVVN